MRRFSSRELFEVRNNIPVTMLIKDELRMLSKISDGVFRFLCPICNEFQTATKATTNLARCFRCERNFNTIDLVMRVRGLEFRESVLLLQHLQGKISNKNEDARQTLNKLIFGIGQPMSGNSK